MKVLIFVASLRSGGAERQTVELLKGLSKDESFELEIVMMSKEIHYSEIYQLNLKIHYLLRSSRFDIGIFWRFYKLVKELNPDIIHSWNSMCSVYAVPTIFLQGIKFINGFLRAAPPTLPIFGQEWIRAKFTFPFSDIILANSQAGLISYGARSKKAKYIHNGFDLTRIENLPSPLEVKKEFGIEQDIVIGMIASFSQNKDYTGFIEVALKVLSERSDITFLAIGDGSNLESCKNMVPHEYRSKIKFLGKQKNVERIIQIIDVGVLLSTPIHGEGISNSIMEFMAMGKPVLASDSGGNIELIANNKTGIIVGLSNNVGVYEGLTKLIESESLRLEMGNKGRERLLKHFNLESMVENYKVLYKNLVPKVLVKEETPK